MVFFFRSIAMNNQTENLRNRLSVLQKRSAIIREIRQFFAQRGYLEIDTPIRIPTPALEDYIEAEPSGNYWLRTSPELHMKRLLAAGVEKVMQLGPCFRQGEFGQRHLSEFTMLEWYRIHTDYLGILEETRDLFCDVAQQVFGVTQITFGDYQIDLACDWEVLTVEEAFEKYASCSLREAMQTNRYEEVLCFEVEPHLGMTRPTVLIDYPAEMAALARKKPTDLRYAERWELYMAGIELANAYSELVNAQEQRERFEQCAELRRREQRNVYPIDEAFLTAMEKGIPPCGGIAVGIDRMIMLFCNCMEIQQVVAFAE